MNRSDRIRTIFSAIVIVLSLWFLWPTYRLATMSKEDQQKLEIENPEKIDKLHKKALKLGLDLKGGMHLTLEVDDSQLTAEEKKDVLDRALEIVRNRVDQFGVSEPTIQKEGSKRIIVQLPGLTDPDRAKRLLGQTAMLEWRLMRQQQEVADVLNKLDQTFRKISGDSLVEVNPEKTDTLGVVPDPTKAAPAAKSAPGESLFAKTKGADELPLNVPLETVDKTKPFTSLLLSFNRDWVLVREENLPLVRRMLARPEALAAMPKDSEFMWFDEWMNLSEGGRGKALMLVAKDEYVSGSNLVSAEPTSNPQSPTQLSVAFTFNRKGARELSRFTGDNVGRFTAIILDGKIKSFPVIKTKIPDGRGVIEGTFTDVEARDLAIILRAGALPAPMFTREERTVGPSLGSDSIRQGMRAGLLGAGAVVVFMMIYYQLSGVIATLGLALTFLSLFGFLAYFGAALTLPGIAGLVLTVGMAVDANVLIYERIREEIRREKTIRSAVDAGYERAFVTILDANLTTLISAVALWQFGTGPIKGFATTLSIGILTSMFAACVFCRLIFNLWVSRPMKKLSI
ncbi:MAG: protein translocase subunit SecD [Candidatus Krumholzibacteria bacterium]|nr:protein translocase subunit SecD [Candidatus Krumholzibacteria bacterium]